MADSGHKASCRARCLPAEALQPFLAGGLSTAPHAGALWLSLDQDSNRDQVQLSSPRCTQCFQGLGAESTIINSHPRRKMYKPLQLYRSRRGQSQHLQHFLTIRNLTLFSPACLVLVPAQFLSSQILVHSAAGHTLVCAWDEAADNHAHISHLKTEGCSGREKAPHFLISSLCDTGALV